MLTAACAGSPKEVFPAQSVEAKPKVFLSKKCEGVAKSKEVKSMEPGEDPNDVALARGVELDLAYSSIDKSNECQARQRRGFAKG